MSNHERMGIRHTGRPQDLVLVMQPQRTGHSGNQSEQLQYMHAGCQASSSWHWAACGSLQSRLVC